MIKKRWIWIAAIVPGLFILVYLIYYGGSTNLASLTYRKSTLIKNQQDLQPEKLPDYHPRKTLWTIIQQMDKNNLAAVSELARREIDAGRGQPVYHLYLGRAYEGEGKIDLAFAEWENSGNEQEVYNSAQRLLQKKQLDDAIRILNLSLAKWPASIYRSNWLFELGEGYFGNRQWDLAAAAYLQVVTDPGLDIRVRTLAYIDAGSAVYSAGKGYQESEGLIMKGILNEPDYYKGYESLGAILRKEGRNQEAKAMYAKAAKRDPQNPWLVVSQIDISMGNDQWDEAKDLIDYGIKEFPTQPHFYYLLAVWFGHAENLDEAITAAQKSISLDSANNLGYRENLAGLYERQGKFKEAFNLCQQILTIDASNKTALDCITRLEQKAR